MSVLAWVVWVGGVLFLVGGVRGVRATWRGERAPPAPLASWLWGDALWRGAVWAQPVGFVAIAFMLAALPLILETDAGSALRGVGLACGALMLATWCLMGVIALFARPRLLIAPQLRDQRGVVAEWLGRSRVGSS